MSGQFLLALWGGLAEPGGDAAVEEIVVNAPKVCVERTFGRESFWHFGPSMVGKDPA